MDLASAAKSHDPSLSVFVGNLPFTVAEEELWTEFAEFGTISYVRVIRDKQTHTGRGFAYVCFAAKQSARMALSKHMASFQGRPMRVFTCKKQVELNVQRRVKGRDAQGEKLRWKRQPPREKVVKEPKFEEYTDPYPGEEQEGQEEPSLPPNLFPKKKRRRDEGPEPAWKEMKREQKKMKSLQKATKEAEQKGKKGKGGKEGKKGKEGKPTKKPKH